ncbi:MAG: hypothetical protein H7336_10100 [Bacteriovorax sp.]|nr:hypothetical protein [Bacteriovorax sp.]
MKLTPFETDGCTMFVDGTREKPELWRHCCVEHDLRYWFGGSESDMDKTDLRLKDCVQKEAGVTWATLIYNGVRAGHHSPIKNKTQWGWAWNTGREKVPLTPAETTIVLAELKNVNVPEVSMDEFLKFYFPNN